MSRAQVDSPAPPATLSAIAWIPRRDLNLPEWSAAGRLLGGMGRCSQWGIGDWIRYGNAKFGQRYQRAARITRYDTQTLMNMVYVSSRFEISRRREILSWSHHEVVAGLEPEEQDYWLGLAIANKLQRRDLREALRAARGGEASCSESELLLDEEQDPALLTCPHCGGEVRVPSATSAALA